MRWAVFWEGFDAAVHSNPNLDNSCKLTYLREAIKDSKVTPLLHRTTSSSTQYEDLLGQLLIERYDQKRLIHQTYSMALIDCAHIKQGSHDELCMFIDTVEHNISSMRDTKQYDFRAFLTSILSNKLCKKLQESWLSFCRDNKEVPDVSMHLKFLKDNMRTTPIYTSSYVKPEVKPEQPHQPKKYRAPDSLPLLEVLAMGSSILSMSVPHSETCQ